MSAPTDFTLPDNVENGRINITQGHSLTGNGLFNSLSGGSGDDVLSGADGNDVLSGNDGNDTLLGGNGNDALFAGFGNDVLDGGAGVDKAFAGPGSTTFFVDNALENVDAYAIYVQADGVDAPGMHAPGMQMFFGRPTMVTRGVSHIHMTSPLSTLLTSEMAVFADLGQDDVHF